MGDIALVPDSGPGGSHGVAACIDVETTGLDPIQHEVVELAVVLFVFDRETGAPGGVVEEYVGLREPSRPIPRQAIAIHGISRQRVKGQRLDDDRIKDLLRRAEFIVAHNAHFDHAFVSRLYPEANQKVWLCSMRGVDWERHGFRSRGLQPLLAAHGVAVGERHRAAADCHGLLALLARRGRGNETYLSELLRRHPHLPGRPGPLPERPASSPRRGAG